MRHSDTQKRRDDPETSGGISTMLALAERSVPRYTSYPAAPHFSSVVGAETYAAWLAQLPETATLSLYLHVPYCAELCLYCGCTTKAVRRRAPVAAYAERLCKEIGLVGDAIGSRSVLHLHWGGAPRRSWAPTP